MRLPVRLLVPALLATAVRVLAHPDPAEARAEFDRLIAEFPNDAELYVRRAAVEIELAAWAAAGNDLGRAQTLAPDSPQVAKRLGEACAARGELTPARHFFDAALKLAPRDAEALVLRARLHARLGETSAALADYSAAITLLEAPSPDLFLARAALPIAPERALRGLDEGLARIGPVPSLLERALTIELSLGRTTAALARLDALATGAERKEMFWKRRGDILAAAGRAAEARAAYARALTAIAALPDWLRTSAETAHLTTELTRLATTPS